MTAEEIKLECLRLALQYSDGTFSAEAMERARKYAEFVMRPLAFSAQSAKPPGWERDDEEFWRRLLG